MASLGKLLVELSADTASFQSDMGRAARIADNRMRSIEKSANNVDRALNSVKRAAGALVSAFAVGGFAHIVKTHIEVADKIQKLGLRLGETTEALSEYRFVAARSGVEFDALATAFQRQTRRIAEAAAGTGEAKKALQELNIDVQKLANLSPAQQFEILAEAIAGVESESRKVALAQKLWDSEGVKLLQVVKSGSAAIADMREQARQLGHSLSQEQANAAAEAADRMTDLSFAMEGAGRAMALLGAGPLAALARDIRDTILLVRQLVDGFRSIENRETLQGLGKGIATLTANVVALNEKIQAQRNIVKGSGGIIADEFRRQIAEDEKRLADMRKRLEALQSKYLQLTAPTQAAPIAALPSGGAAAAASGLTVPIKIRPEFDDGTAGFKAKLEAMYQPVKSFNETLAADATRVFEATRTPIERYQEEIARLNELVGLGAVTQETYNRAVAQAQDTLDAASRGTEALSAAAQDLGLTFASAFEDAVVEGKKLSDVLKGLAQDIARVLVRRAVTEPLANALTSALGGAFPARASGGPVTGSRPYLVGERGPELFVPGASGAIVPNGAFGGGASVVINNYSGMEANASRRTVNGREITEVTIGQAANDVRRGGQLARAFEQTYGVARRGVVR